MGPPPPRSQSDYNSPQQNAHLWQDWTHLFQHRKTELLEKGGDRKFGPFQPHLTLVLLFMLLLLWERSLGLTHA